MICIMQWKIVMLWIETPAIVVCIMMKSVSPHCRMNAAECTAELQLLHRSAGSLQYSYTTCISNQLPPATWKQNQLSEIISMYLIKFWPWPLSDGDMGECCVESACMRQFSAWQQRSCSDHSQAQTLSTTHFIVTIYTSIQYVQWQSWSHHDKWAYLMFQARGSGCTALSATRRCAAPAQTSSTGHTTPPGQLSRYL